MIVVRQSILKTSLAMGVLVAGFAVLGVYGLATADTAGGRRVAIALLAAAAVFGMVVAVSLLRGRIVAVLRQDGIELHSGHFARWGLIRWRDVAEVFLFRTTGLKAIGLRLDRASTYYDRTPSWIRWSLWLDRNLTSGADAYLSASAMKASAEEVARLVRIFQHSPAVRAHFGREDVVLEFPTDVALTDVLKVRVRSDEET